MKLISFSRFMLSGLLGLGLTSSVVLAQQSAAPLSNFHSSSKSKRIIVAYVTAWSNTMPDPNFVTHINYAFGHVTKTFNGVSIQNEPRLREIVALKKSHPDLKVLLSIGGWTAGGFSEMAAEEKTRNEFAEDCLRVVREYGLDGIDIDWEYPTSSAAKIVSSPDDTKNYTLLMARIRKLIGSKKLLTLASVSDAQYIDFKAVTPLVNFVNVMTYDMGTPPKHHAGLYRSEHTPEHSVDEGVMAHLKAGIPPGKLVLGIPFYGHGSGDINWYIDYKDIVNLKGYTEKWDDKAQAPYFTNGKGEFVLTYENPKSIAIKCEYLKSKGLLGAMYWDYSADTPDGILRKSVYEGVMQK